MKEIEVTKKVKVSGNLVLPISETYSITKTIEYDERELKDYHGDLDELIEVEFEAEFREEAEDKLREDWEKRRPDDDRYSLLDAELEMDDWEFVD